MYSSKLQFTIHISNRANCNSSHFKFHRSRNNYYGHNSSLLNYTARISKHACSYPMIKQNSNHMHFQLGTQRCYQQESHVAIHISIQHITVHFREIGK